MWQTLCVDCLKRPRSMRLGTNWSCMSIHHLNGCYKKLSLRELFDRSKVRFESERVDHYTTRKYRLINTDKRYICVDITRDLRKNLHLVDNTCTSAFKLSFVFTKQHYCRQRMELISTLILLYNLRTFI